MPRSSRLNSLNDTQLACIKHCTFTCVLNTCPHPRTWCSDQHPLCNLSTQCLDVGDLITFRMDARKPLNCLSLYLRSFARPLFLALCRSVLPIPSSSCLACNTNLSVLMALPVVLACSACKERNLFDAQQLCRPFRVPNGRLLSPLF